MFNKTEAYISKAVKIWWLKQIAYYFVMCVLVFSSAQTYHWESAWFYLVFYAGTTIANAAFMDKDLMIERSRLQMGTRKWDKWLYAFIYFWGPIAVLITSGIEHRLSTHSFLPKGVQIIGFLLLFIGGLLITRTFSVNPFYTSTMRIQYEREHRLISHGPYRIVRHPGYLGSILATLATPVALGSGFAIILSFGVTFGIVFRTYLEDVILTRQFKGYYEYTKKVKYRLIPGLW